MSSIWSSLTNLFRWVYRAPNVENIPSGHPESLPPDTLQAPVDTARPEDFSRGWEWVLTNAEKEMEKMIQSQQSHKYAELRQLRKVSFAVSYRPLILQHVATLYSRLDREDTTLLLDSRLDSSLRNGILRDILADLAEQWEDIVRQILLHDLAMRELRKVVTTTSYKELAEDLVESLSDSWIEEKYKKNVIGELKASALQASSSAETTGLTTKVLSDILWTFSLTLSRATSSWFVPPRALSQMETGIIVSQILQSAPAIVQLWIETSRNSASVIEKVGRLPSQWKREESVRKVEPPSAKFNDGSADSFLKGNRTLIKKEDLDEIRSRLASLLILKPKVPPASLIVKKEDFNETRQKLSTLLTFKAKKVEEIEVLDFQARRKLLAQLLPSSCPSGEPSV